MSLPDSTQTLLQDCSLHLRIACAKCQSEPCQYFDVHSTASHVLCRGYNVDQEILGKCVCQTFHSDELLQPRQPFLAALRFLSLLHQGQSQDARPILAMQQARKKGEADLERVYYPYMLQIFQVRAVYLTSLLMQCVCLCSVFARIQPQMRFVCPTVSSTVHVLCCPIERVSCRLQLF